MSRQLALLNAAQLVTLAGPDRPRVGREMEDLAIVENGGMLILGGRIAKIGPSREIEPLLDKDAEIVDAGRKVVMPGFVDAHTHLVFAGNRVEEFQARSKGATYEQIAAAGGGIRITVAKTRAASEEELLEQAKRHSEWFLKSGTTTVEAKSGYGLSLESELKILRVMRRLAQETPLKCVPTFLGAHAIPPEFERNPCDYVDEVVETMLPAVRAEKLAEFCDVFCEGGYFSIEQSRRVLIRARELGLGLRIHADQLSNSGGAALAAELSSKTADHLEQTDLNGIAALKGAGVQPVLLPASVYALGKSKYPAAREMIDAGLAVVVATDFNPGSSPTPSMPMVLSLACTQMRMSPAEAVTAATINAAYSLNRGERIGTLEPNKDADFVIWDCEDYREIVYWLGAPQVERVLLNASSPSLKVVRF